MSKQNASIKMMIFSGQMVYQNDSKSDQIQTFNIFQCFCIHGVHVLYSGCLDSLGLFLLSFTDLSTKSYSIHPAINPQTSNQKN